MHPNGEVGLTACYHHRHSPCVSFVTFDIYQLPLTLVLKHENHGVNNTLVLLYICGLFNYYKLNKSLLQMV